jgi:WD40 repeat protein
MYTYPYCAFSANTPYIHSQHTSLHIKQVPMFELVTKLEGHTELIAAATVSLNNKVIASCGDDTTVRLWDSDTNKLIGSFQAHPKGTVWKVDLSYDGKYVVTSGAADDDDTLSGSIKVWEMNSDSTAPKLLQSLPTGDGYQRSLRISPDGQKVAIICIEESSVRIWDVKSGKLTHCEHGTSVEVAAFSPDSKQVASGSGDGTIHVWDPATGTQIMDALEGHNGAVTCLVFGSRPNLLVSGSSDNTAMVWELPKIGGKGRKKAPVGKALEITAWIKYLFLSPDDKYIVCGSIHEEAMRVWEVGSGKQVRLLKELRHQVQGVVWSHDRRIVRHFLALTCLGATSVNVWALGKVILCERCECESCQTIYTADPCM